MSAYRKLTGIAISLLLLVIASPAWGLDSLFVDIENANVIRNPDNNNDSRLILRFDMPELLDTNKHVTHAELRFRIDPNRQIDHPPRFILYPITLDWDIQDADWDSPWQEAGGDYVDSLSAMVHLDLDEITDMTIQISHLVQSFIRNDLPNNGFIVCQQGPETAPFDLVAIDDDNNLAQLAIYYSTLQPDE
ncbi:MAG: DNRLRE domain-containing protein [candidate division Zixibacteria bacterium]|nr:DNRLRE domain-containing protein [candidate division Zixibacteria bacterium]